MLLCGSTRGERTYGTHVGICEPLGLSCQNEHIASCLPLKLTSGIAQEHDFGQVHIIIRAVRDLICCLEFRGYQLAWLS